MNCNWIPYPKNKPVVRAQYLVTQQITDTRKIVSIVNWTDNLYEVDRYDFDKRKHSRSGFYSYDSEYGYYEVTGVIGWQPAPDPMQ